MIIMYRQPSKRQRVTKRVLVYSLMSTSVIIIVSVLMLLVLGYSFNQKDNRLEQGGLLQFASVPSGATVTLDEVTLGTRTPGKITADVGSHTVTMNLKGYRSWQKTINLTAGQIGWLSYARLIPTDPKAEKLRPSATLSGTLGSLTGKWMALLEDATKPNVVVANLQNDTPTYKTIAIPTTNYTQPSAGQTQTFSLDSWSHNEQYLLIKHTYDTSKVEWLVVNRDDATKTQNITTLLGLTADKVLFGAENGRTVYAISSGVVRKVNLDSLTLSRPLESNVVDFSVFDYNTLLYTTAADPVTKLRSIGYETDDMQAGQTLDTFADDGLPLHVAMSDYFGVRYMAVSKGQTVIVSSGTLPRPGNKGNMDTQTTITSPSPIEWLTSSTNGRFFVVQYAGSYTTRDLELDKTDTTTLKGTLTTDKPLHWLDSFSTWSDRTGMLRLYEFDGANQQNITAVAQGFDATIPPNNKYIYSIAPDGTGFVLQRVRLVLN